MAYGITRYKLKFDDSYNDALFVVQADSGRTLQVQVLDELNNVQDITGYGLSFYVSINETVTQVDGTVLDAPNGIFEIELVSSQFMYAGMGEAQFVMTNPDGLKIGSKLAQIRIEESIQNGATTGRNVVVDFSRIDTAVELLTQFEGSLSMAQELTGTLDGQITTGTTVSEALAGNISAGNTTNSDLSDTITAGNALDDSLNTKLNDGAMLATDLDTANDAATTNLTNLNAANELADSRNTALTTTINNANTINDELEANISNANLDEFLTTAKTISFTQATVREPINTADTILQMFGKISKYQADYKAITFSALASDLIQDSNNRLVSDAEKDTWNSKQDKLTAGANVNITDNVISAEDTIYEHPTTHPASMIEEDTNNRFVSDSEKNTWDAKQNALTQGANITISGNTISAVDTVYTHPSSHPASIIIQTSTARFVSDEEKTTWNAKASTDVATTSANGLMSAAMVAKLNSIPADNVKRSLVMTQSSYDALSTAEKERTDTLYFISG